MAKQIPVIANLIGQPLECAPSRRFEFIKAEYEGGLSEPKPTPGTWYWFAPYPEAPYIVCPRCGNAGRLGKHKVAINGLVEPSIICSWTNPGDGVARCDAHYYGKLKDYEPRKKGKNV